MKIFEIITGICILVFDVLVAVNRTNQEINIKIPEEFESESSKDEFKINATKEKLGPFGGIAILK